MKNIYIKLYKKKENLYVKKKKNFNKKIKLNYFYNNIVLCIKISYLLILL